MTSASHTYKSAGVDIKAGNRLVERIKPLAAATQRAGSLDGLGGFGGLFDLKAAGYVDPILVAATDGVGTKVLLAIQEGLYDHLGIDLVAMCVNDLVTQGAEPLFFLDYFATGKLNEIVAQAVVASIAQGCIAAGCALIGGETAEMPTMYGKGHFDLAGFAVGAVERDRLLPRRDDICAGDRLVGLPASGLHSNGFSLVRKILADQNLNLADSPPFDAPGTLAEALLTPTRLYVTPCLAASRSGAVKAMAHITGGGVTENIPRILPPGRIAQIDWESLPGLPVYDWLMGLEGVVLDDLRRTFNMGAGMVLVCAPDQVDVLQQILRDAGEENSFILGQVT